jgi:hypothetical protein
MFAIGLETPLFGSSRFAVCVMNFVTILTVGMVYVNLSLSMICMVQIRGTSTDNAVDASHDNGELQDNQTRIDRNIRHNFTASSSAIPLGLPVSCDMGHLLTVCLTTS